MKVVHNLLALSLRLGRFSVGSLRRLLRKAMTHDLCRKYTEEPSCADEKPVRANGASFASLLESHGHTLLHGPSPMPTSLNLANIRLEHLQTCHNCLVPSRRFRCSFWRWAMTLSHGYSPKLIPHMTMKPKRHVERLNKPNYPSFYALGSHSIGLVQKLLDKQVLQPIDSCAKVQAVSRHGHNGRYLLPTPMGAIVKSKDILEAKRLGFDAMTPDGLDGFNRRLKSLGRNPCKVRLVLDSSGSGLNDMIEGTPFSYPPRYDAEALIFPGCMMGKTDLEAYFNQFPLAPLFSWLTSVQSEDQRLVHLRCPFGLKTLPYYASIMSAFISEGLVRRGIPNSFLLDDFFVTADNLEAIKAVLLKVNQFIRSLGLPVQDAKVEFGTKLAFLGLIYDSCTMTVRVDPRAAAAAIITIESEILPHIHCHEGHWTVAPLHHYGKRLESLTGTLNWFCECIQSGRSHLNGFYNLARWGSSSHSHVLARLVDDIEWWRTVLQSWVSEDSPEGTYPIISGKSLSENPEKFVYCVQTDASGTDGRGGYHGPLGCKNAQFWSTSWLPEEISIRQISMSAELHALLDFCRQNICKNKLLVWITDSTAAAFVVLKGYTSVQSALPLLREIMELVDSQGNQLIALWVPRTENMFADYLSHLSIILNTPHVNGSQRMG